MQLHRLRSIANPSNAPQWLGEGLLIFSVMIGTACQSQRVEPPVTKARPDTERVLGYFRPVMGTSHLIAPIVSKNSGDYSVSSNYDSGRGAYNYVFVNSADESTLTLLPTNDYLFVSTVSLPEKREGDKEPFKVQWFLYGLVKMDTDSDRALTYKDRRSLCVSDAGGSEFKEVIVDVEHVYGHTLRDADTLIVIYRKGSNKYLTRINLPSREAVYTKEIPDFGVAE